jgi:MFS transporter, DHA1 family, multidrug resistance protein
MDDPAMKSQRYSLAILFLTLMIVNTGFGIILPILPYYAQSLGASATVLGLLSGTYATLQFIFAPLWGRLSDRIGRRPVLLVGLIGFSLSFLIFGLASRLWMLFLARIISGLLSSATLPTALAYIADTTPPENRARGMGLMGAAGGIGMILGPAIGGFLGALSPQTPFFFSAGLSLLVVTFAWFLLPESLPSHLRTNHPSGTTASHGRLGLILTALRGPLAFLMVLATLTSFGMAQLESTAALFARVRFGAGEAEMGAMFMLMGFLGVFAQFVLVARVIRRLGERHAIQVSLLGVGLSFLLFGMVRTYPPAIAVVVLMGLTTSFLRPALNTLVSRSAPPSEQGITMGLVNSFYSLGMMFGPITGGLIYDHLGIAWPFYSASLIHFIALAASLLLFHTSAVPTTPGVAQNPGK